MNIVQNPGHAARWFRGMPHSESGACRTLFPKNSKKAKRWLIPKMWHATSQENKEVEMAQERLTLRKSGGSSSIRMSIASCVFCTRIMEDSLICLLKMLLDISIFPHLGLPLSSIELANGMHYRRGGFARSLDIMARNLQNAPVVAGR